RAKAFFKVTVGRYYTVSGKTPQIEGVLSDLPVATRYAYERIGERYLNFPLRPDRVTPAYADPLLDIEGGRRLWFQLHYLPNLQKRLTHFTQMVPVLRDHSAQRLEKNNNYQNFIKVLKGEKPAASAGATDLT